jgi:cytochrome c peroxidase
MITLKLKQFIFALFGVALLASCQKDLTESQSEIDQKRVRGLNITLSDKAVLGRAIYFDASFSNPAGMQSCSSCHLPETGFVGRGDLPSGPNSRGFRAGIGEGAVAGAFGGRKPPSSAYATFAPAFTFDAVNDEFIGGLFWDGRATGAVTGEPAGDQAIGPFLNPVEHNMADKAAVLSKIANSKEYRDMWRRAWGVEFNMSNSTLIDENYKKVGLAIAAFEGSGEVNQFTSKFDAVQRNQAQFSALEQQGMNLFISAECNNCHSMEPVGAVPALFTDFSYDNIGLPQNIEFLNTSRRNPAASLDSGLGQRLAASADPVWRALAPDFVGAFKTPTLRNVARGEANKRFMHNGVLKSLKEVVHFYNTRDTDPTWAAPEFPATMNTRRVGDLRLTSAEEDAIVAFMRTLTDGWRPGVNNNQGVL